MTSVEFHRLEMYELPEQSIYNDSMSIICSFDTDRFGYYQIELGDDGLYHLTDEPPINVFTEEQQRKIKLHVVVVWMLLGGPKPKIDSFK